MSGNFTTEDILATQRQFKNQVLEELNQFPFEAPGWLKNRHLQTIGARYARKVPVPPFKSERWETPDQDILHVHFSEGEPDKPIALLLHGLEGCRESTYILGLTQMLNQIGWNVAVMEFRSCSGEINQAKRLYHSGETTDAAWVVEQLIKRYPGKSIYMAGYSLGGNVTAKWLGENGENVPEAVKAAAVISAPYNLVECQNYMDNSLACKMYIWRFIRTLTPKAIEKHNQYPGCLDIDAVLKARTWKGFDDAATAPLHGFKDAYDYYTSVQCGQFVEGIRRPTLLLSAADDPFNPGHTFPVEASEKSPWLHPQLTESGGHVGFVRKGDTSLIGFWSEEQIVRFFQSYHRLLH
jgi:hypothetical protein